MSAGRALPGPKMRIELPSRLPFFRSVAGIGNALGYLRTIAGGALRAARRRTEEQILQQNIETIRHNGFWFIDIPRCSTTSIKIELAQRFGPLYGKTIPGADSRHVGQFVPDHETARAMRKRLGATVWEELFTFTLVRNPWDRMYSLYRFRMKHYPWIPRASLSEYLSQLDCPNYMARGSMHNFHGNYYGAHQYIHDDDGRQIVSFVGRYENRAEDLHTIGERIGCPELGAKHLNTAAESKSAPSYVEAYTPETRALVARVFARDIEEFGYEFGK